MKHTPEPWPAPEYNNDVDSDDDGFWEWYEIEGVGTLGVSEANARRIVACVNACAGIETMILEMDTPKFVAMLRERIEYRKQRADLFESLVALSATVSTLCSWDRRFDEVLDAADAAVARSKADHFRDATKMIEGAPE
jgi:hypothetical protein